MKNLFKNVFRSFSKNKLAIVSLTFLTFLSFGIFCVTKSALTNITNSYNDLMNNGNRHDLVMSELYDDGQAKFKIGNNYIDYDQEAKAFKFHDLRQKSVEDRFIDYDNCCTLSGEDAEKKLKENVSSFVLVPSFVLSNEKTIVFSFKLFLSDQLSTGLFCEYAKAASLEKREIKISVSAESAKYQDYLSLLEKINNGKISSDDLSSFVKLNSLYSTLNSEVATQLRLKQQEMYATIMSSDKTPLLIYLKDKYSQQLAWRRRKSVSINNADTHYKLVESNADDTIDKIVLTKPSNSNHRGHQIFNYHDWKPFGIDFTFYDQNGTIITNEQWAKKNNEIFPDLPATVADLFDFDFKKREDIEKSQDLKVLYPQIIQKRCAYYLAGQSKDDTEYHQDVVTLAHLKTNLSSNSIIQYCSDFWKEGTAIYKAYENITKIGIGRFKTFSIKHFMAKKAEQVNTISEGCIAIQWAKEAAGVSIPYTCRIANLTSDFVVINPQYLDATKKSVIESKAFTDYDFFNKWWKQQKKSSSFDLYSSSGQKDVLQWLNSISLDEFEGWTKWLWETYPQYMINCGSFHEIIWGSGITPDYAYPVFDFQHLIPEHNSQCFIFCNSAGYGQIYLGYRNAQTENYLVAKFKNVFDRSTQQKILDDLQEYSYQKTIYPRNIKTVCWYDDTTSVLNLSGYRIAYVQKFLDKIHFVTNLLCFFIVAICIIICFVVIRHYVQKMRISIGVLRANGVPKSSIAFSLLPFAAMPSVIGGITSYFFGFFLQGVTVKLFANYWSLPTSFVSFDLFSLILCVILPFVMFGLICFVSTYLIFREKAIDLIKLNQKVKHNFISILAKKGVTKFSIVTRFRVAVAFSSLWKLLVLSFVSAMTMASLTFAVTSAGKLKSSQLLDKSQYEYKYGLKLTTPTATGGPYLINELIVSESKKDSCLGSVDPKNYLFNIAWNPDKYYEGDDSFKTLTKHLYSHKSTVFSGSESYYRSIGNMGNLLIPDDGDGTFQVSNLFYLQNKVCSKLVLDHDMGSKTISMSSNPWKIALALMPVNAKNLSNEAFEKIFNDIFVKIKNAKESEYWFVSDGRTPAKNQLLDCFKIDNKNGHLVGWNESKIYASLWGSIVGFSELFVKLLDKIYHDINGCVEDEYWISYGTIPVTNDDELYTYIDASVEAINQHHQRNNSSVTIFGIEKNSRYIKLSCGDEKINDVLFDSQQKSDLPPIIVNSYAAYKHHLSIGDKMEFAVQNHVDRYLQKIHPDDKKYQTTNPVFQIVGISDGTSNESYYTTREIANNILGLPNGKDWNKSHKYMWWDENPNMNSYRKSFGLIDFATKESYFYDKWNKKTKEIKTVDHKDMIPSSLKVPNGFNGLFTSRSKPKNLTSLPLYSYTSMYPGTSMYKGVNDGKFAKILAKDLNLAIANRVSGINEKKYEEACLHHLNLSTKEKQKNLKNYESIINEFTTLLERYYGSTTMYTAINNVIDTQAMEQITTSLTKTVNLLETIIMSIVLPMTIIIVGLISSLIIDDNKRLAKILKTLGYRDSENILSFLSIYVPVIVIGLIVAIPISMLCANVYHTMLFNEVNILVNLTIKWWYVLIACGSIMGILGLNLCSSYWSIKKEKITSNN